MLQFTIKGSTLSAATTELCRVVNKKASRSILEGILFEMDEVGRVNMTASDDVKCEMTTELQSEKWQGSGSFVVNATQLTYALSGLTEDVTLTHDKQRLTIQYGIGSLSIDTDKVEEFSRMKVDEEAEALSVLSMDGKMLCESIARVQYAVAKDVVRICMNGVRMEYSEGLLSFAATDGRMLSVVDRQFSHAKDFGCILPIKVCNLLKSSVRGERVKMLIGKTNIVCEFGTYRLVANLIEQAYPKFRQLIKPSPSLHITIDKAALLACVIRVGKFADSTSQSVKVRYEDNTLHVSGEDNDLFSRSMTEAIAVKDVWADKEQTPKSFAIGLSAPLLQKTLESFNGDVVELQYEDVAKPIHFVGDIASSLQMPMILEEKPKEEPKAEEAEEAA